MSQLTGRARLILATCAAAVVLIAAGARLASSSPEGASSGPTLTPITTVAPAHEARSGCWVTGDLVGEANPADVVATAC